MYSDKQRVATYLQTSIKEIELVEQMSAPIHEPNDFGIDISGMTIFRQDSQHSNRIILCSIQAGSMEVRFRNEEFPRS